MNFLAMPTLKNVRSCLRLPISMMPRFSLKLTLARLRTGIDSVGSLLRSAAVITASATLISFFSTAPDTFALARAMSFYLFFRFVGTGRFASAGRFVAVGRFAAVLPFVLAPLRVATLVDAAEALSLIHISEP